jgi:hypothetical protein
VSVLGLARFGSVFSLSVLDFVNLGSCMALRSMARCGSALAVTGLARFGSSISILDFTFGQRSELAIVLPAG